MRVSGKCVVSITPIWAPWLVGGQLDEYTNHCGKTENPAKQSTSRNRFSKRGTYNLTPFSRFHVFYQTHFHFYFKDVSGFSNFIVAK